MRWQDMKLKDYREILRIARSINKRSKPGYQFYIPSGMGSFNRRDLDHLDVVASLAEKSRKFAGVKQRFAAAKLAIFETKIRHGKLKTNSWFTRSDKLHPVLQVASVLTTGLAVGGLYSIATGKYTAASVGTPSMVLFDSLVGASALMSGVGTAIVCEGYKEAFEFYKHARQYAQLSPVQRGLVRESTEQVVGDGYFRAPDNYRIVNGRVVEVASGREVTPQHFSEGANTGLLVSDSVKTQQLMAQIARPINRPASGATPIQNFGAGR